MKQLINYLVRVTSLILLFPYIVALTPTPDSSFTSVQVGFGLGSYTHVSRDCSGNIVSTKIIPFKDAGISVEHHIDNISFGAKGGYINIDKKAELVGFTVYRPEAYITYISPNLGYSSKNFGINWGVLIPLQKFNDANWIPSGYMRAGNLQGVHVSSSYAYNIPLFSGGGLLDIGIGIGSEENKNQRIFLGLAFLPYEGWGFSFKGDFPVTEKVLFDLRGRLGANKKVEYGISLGTKMIF